MTWNAMSPDEVCGAMEFWQSLEWPLVRHDLNVRTADRFGWEIREERGIEYLVNMASGLNMPEVMMAEFRTPQGTQLERGEHRGR